MSKFHEVLYKYSHTKFDEFLETPEVRFLFSQVLTPNFVEPFIVRHETLVKSKERYINCANDLIEQMEKFRNKFVSDQPVEPSSPNVS